MPTSFLPQTSLPLDLSLPIPVAEVALAATGLALAGLVKGVTGIGYATCAMPLLAIAVGLDKALALVVLPAIVSNWAVLAGGGEVLATLRRFRPLYLAIVPGIACGTALLGLVDTGIATTVLALLTLTYVALASAKPQLALPPRLERPLALPTGFLSGLLTGLTGSQILPLVPYMLALRLAPDTQVQAVNLAVMSGSMALGAALLAAGILTPELLALSALGALPAIGGTLAGNRLRGLVPAEGLRRLTLAVLVIVAISLGGRPVLEATLATACGPAAAQLRSSDAIAACLQRALPAATAVAAFAAGASPVQSRPPTTP